MDREDTTQALIESLQTRYPTRGFKIHPAISFSLNQSSDGIGCIAKDDIKQDEILLVIPNATRISTSNVMNTKELRNLSKNIERKCKQVNAQMIAPEDFALVVAVMHVLSKKQTEPTNPFVLQAFTWPSENEMKESSMFYWDESKIKEIWNRSLLDYEFTKRRENVRQIFEEAIFPLLKNDSDNFVDTSLASNTNALLSQKDALRNTFVYAFSLQWSRAHASPDTELVPLVELLNGNSSRVNQSEKPGKLVDKLVINVAMASGKWPFLEGSIFRDGCNLPCSAIYASRDLEKGEELFIDYGDLSPVSFVYQYGTLPANFISHHDIQTEVSVWCDPSLISTNHRLECFRRHDFIVEELKSNSCILCNIGLEDYVDMYLQGCYEPDSIKNIRRISILCMLTHEELERNLALKVPLDVLYKTQVLPLMCQIIDYNLKELDHSNKSSANDMERAKKSGTPAWEKAALLARLSYRESLIRWRHAIARQGIPSHVDGKNNGLLPCLASGGCALCGRTYPCLMCTRCKKVKY